MTRRRKHDAQKASLIEQFGGACQSCGYNRLHRALHFHHLDSSEKRDWSNGRGHASLDEAQAYPKRFALLCATCHIEAHEETDALARLRNQRQCQLCGKHFPVIPSRMRDNDHGKYCRKSCYSAARRKASLETNSVRFQRFITHVGEHWVWTGWKIKTTPILLQPVEGRSKWVGLSAYRVSYEIQHGQPATKKLNRTCDKALCVRHIA